MQNLIARERHQCGPSIEDLQKSIIQIQNQDKIFVVELLAVDGSDQLAGVYFQYHKMQSVLEQFGHMIFVDVTYNVNVEKYNLLTFLVADGENKGHPVGYAYIQNESQPILSLYKTLKLSNRQNVDIFMLDKDMKCINALKKNFPQSSIILCYFHVMKYFKEKLRCLITGSSHKKETVLSLIRALVRSRSTIHISTS